MRIVLFRKIKKILTELTEISYFLSKQKRVLLAAERRLLAYPDVTETSK